MNRIITTLAAIAIATSALAQSDFGLWYSIDAKKKLNDKWSLGAEVEVRTNNDAKNFDRFSIEANGTYKVSKYLKLGGAYNFIRDWNPERETAKGNLIEAYWTTRHRVSASATGIYKWKMIEFSLREAFQYTHRLETSAGKTKNGKEKDDEIIEAYDRNVLRTKIQIALELNRFEPYASVEWHNRLSETGLEKTRYTMGCKCQIIKPLSLNLYYRYQDIKEDTNQKIVGIGVSFKL